MSGILYLVATPIGNLGDFSYRGIETLKLADRVLAEDTRNTKYLLNHYEIQAKTLEPFHAHNEYKKVYFYTERLKEGENIALVSDAGTPAISDPGFLLCESALENNIKVEVIPGATAFVPALIKSGFALHRFIYEGFLPLKKGRKTRLDNMLAQEATTVFYESPHRIVKTLNFIVEAGHGSRKISVSRELTKKFEETLTKEASELLKHFTETAPKGEFVVVLEGTEQYESRTKQVPS